jgi:hypothetical protein
MRFEISHVLDAIERHLTTEVALAQAVVDVGEVAWYEALDGGRPVNLLRLGQAVDALARHLGEDAVMVYPVAGRPLLTDADLTSKERMVLGRWASDGQIEVVPAVADRVPEVGDITGLPIVTRGSFAGLERRYPWLRGQPDRVLQLVPAETGARLLGSVPGPAQPPPPGSALLSRIWRCQRRDCPTFGDRRAMSQAVPRMRAGVPICPRHEEPLTNVGAKPPSMTLVVAIDGAVRERFVVRMGRPLVVGRSPDDPDGIRIGEWLTGDAAAMVSRSHVRLELRDDALYAVDMSTNGTIVRSRSGPYSAADEVHLTGAPAYPLKPWDTVELYQGVTVSRADRHVGRSSEGPGSVMGDAPTITMRPNF